MFVVNVLIRPPTRSEDAAEDRVSREWGPGIGPSV
jgi:hypothetical protein